MKVSISGYRQDEVCQHCGRLLKHGIILDNGMVVGSVCLDKQMTEPKEYNGKKYRIGSTKIIEYAKMVEKWTPEKLSRLGICGESIQFTMKE